MAQLIVPNAAQLRILWANGGQLYAVNVLGVVANAVAITQALTNTIGAAIKTAFTSSGYAGSCSTVITLANVGLRDVRTGNAPEFIDSGAAVAGTPGTQPLPPQVALCVTLRTALAGQSFRGRVYLPGYDESVNVGGALTGSGGAVSFVSGIQSALQANGLNLGVLSRPAPDAVPPRAGFITPVTAVILRDAVWDTQRRRAIPGI